MFNVQLELLYVLLPVRSRQRTDERSNSNPSNQNGQADARSQNGETRLPWHKRLWFQLAYQETPGRRALFRLRFCVGFFLGLCIMFLVGGGFLLSFSLQQVQIRVTYSGASPLDQFNNEQRSLLMQGQSTCPTLSPRKYDHIAAGSPCTCLQTLINHGDPAQ